MQNKPTSKVIQICTLPEGKSIIAGVFVLCEDGSIWHFLISKGSGVPEWKRVLEGEDAN